MVMVAEVAMENLAIKVPMVMVRFKRPMEKTEQMVAAAVEAAMEATRHRPMTLSTLMCIMDRFMLKAVPTVMVALAATAVEVAMAVIVLRAIGQRRGFLPEMVVMGATVVPQAEEVMPVKLWRCP